MIKPTDANYPLAMNLVPFAEKYELMQIDNLVVVPLFQVIDTISEVKADIVVHNGVECCPMCMKPIKGTFTKADLVAMLEQLDSEIQEQIAFMGDGEETNGMKRADNLIKDKINALKQSMWQDNYNGKKENPKEVE